MADTASEGYVDRWITYGRMADGFQPFSAKELTVDPGAKATIKDNGAYSLITTQGAGRINDQPLDCPNMIGFTDLTRDEYFVTAGAATEGVTFENTTAHEPLVILRYFGPEVNPQAPRISDRH